MTAEVVTAAMMNTHVRDNENFLYTPPMFRAYHSAAQALTTGTLTQLALNSERFDTDTMHDTATNNSRGTVKTAGKYLFFSTIRFAANSTGQRSSFLKRNGVAGEYIAALIIGAHADFGDLSVASVYSFAVNDYVQIEAAQNSGGNLNVDTVNFYSPELGAVFLGN